MHTMPTETGRPCTDVTGNCTKYTYDLLGRMTGVRDEKTGFLATYEYTKTGDLKKVDTPVLQYGICLRRGPEPDSTAHDGGRRCIGGKTSCGQCYTVTIKTDREPKKQPLQEPQNIRMMYLDSWYRRTTIFIPTTVPETGPACRPVTAGKATSYDRGRLTTRTVEHTAGSGGQPNIYIPLRCTGKYIERRRKYISV